jgi:hypothetical protein
MADAPLRPRTEPLARRRPIYGQSPLGIGGSGGTFTLWSIGGNGRDDGATQLRGAESDSLNWWRAKDGSGPDRRQTSSSRPRQDEDETGAPVAKGRPASAPFVMGRS